MTHIKPTVGRVLWYFESNEQAEPLSAQIAKVNEDGTVNIGYLRQSGQARSVQDVPTLQPGEDVESGHFCMWMPYQLGQAAKTEAAEKQIAAGRAVASGSLPAGGLSDPTATEAVAAQDVRDDAGGS